jgi:hypothetical protein
MLEARSDMNLGKEPLGAEYCGELGEQDFDCDLSSVAEIFGEVDCRHSALTDLAVDAVSIGEGSGEAVSGSCHATIIGALFGLRHDRLRRSTGLAAGLSEKSNMGKPLKVFVLSPEHGSA